MVRPRQSRLPPWLRVPYTGGRSRLEVRSLLSGLGLNTVCQSARCPNLCDCWARKAATFLVMGERCTRHCRFCAVGHGDPRPLDPTEPARVAEAAARLGLRYVVITCVTRDDVSDHGTAHLVSVLQAVRARLPEAGIEMLVSDLGGVPARVAAIVGERPTVFNHNLETVERLTPGVRHRADYRRSLDVLRAAAEVARGTPVRVKSGLMLGLGETDDEVRQALRDLRAAGVAIVTLGQYLPPTPDHWPLDRYVHPDEFAAWEAEGTGDLGFDEVVAGPLVRSSYRADEAAAEAGEA